ncbi:hypothetical protein TRFO_14646 [Tritrichomonas foetus]|uniref:Polymorphic outer membrane protein n=1 Tax=Tritrichomonas foetus TaxID=1144522 RepID=A0A1J4KUN3_9EUKA|nr:hypothetical protein TRFO_14646 [Tritrichomonas foetus]|eukprot:OHT14979.1 hypothetical protein TRFO_14646 [Tritrichomonas foetus]
MIFLLLSLSTCFDAKLFHLSSVVHNGNTSLSLSSISKQKFLYQSHPLFLLNRRRSTNIFTLFSSNFAYFSSPIIHSSSSLNIINCNFRNSQKAIVLSSSGAEYKSNDFSSRYISSTEAHMKDCSFHALSSVQGPPEQTTGGSFYSNGFKVTFLNCVFTGNSAQSGGAAAIFNTIANFDICNFSQNHAAMNTGAVLIEKCDVSFNDCNFVQNQAEIGIGALHLKFSTMKAEAVIFHKNSAQYQTGAVEIQNSQIQLIGTQFSGNMCAREHGGISVYSKNSSTIMIGCNFDTSVTEGQDKSPIVTDKFSVFKAKMCCFDANEQIMRKKLEGNIDMSLHNSFGKSCHCNPVPAQVPFDVSEFNVKLHSNLFSSNFIGNIIVILVATLSIAVFMLYKNQTNPFEKIQTL